MGGGWKKCAVGGWQPENWRGRAQEHMEEVQELLVFAERGSRGMKCLILGSFQDCLLPAPFSSSPTPIVVYILLLWSQRGWEQDVPSSPVKGTLPLLCELSETRSLPRAVPHPMQKDRFLFASVQFLL